jgi:non-heme chloroperoxidase
VRNAAGAVQVQTVRPTVRPTVDSKDPNRGPLLLISSEADHTIPPALVEGAYKKQRRNEGVTEIATIPNRGLSLTIDNGWREAADKALAFVKRFV